MSKINIEAGQRFNRWTVIATGYKHIGKNASFCRCDCGNEAIVINSSMHTGKSTSCGCVRAEKLKWRKTPLSSEEKQAALPPKTRLVELTDKRHNANDCIGSGVILPRGMSSMSTI